MQPASAYDAQPDRGPLSSATPIPQPDTLPNDTLPKPLPTAHNPPPEIAAAPFPSAQEIFRRSQTQVLKSAIAASMLNLYSVPLLYRMHRSD